MKKITTLCLLIFSLSLLNAQQINVIPNQIFVGTNVKFSLQGQDVTRLGEISWDFGDSTPQVSGPNPNHSYKEPGNYTVKCFLQTASAAQEEIQKVINVNDRRRVLCKTNNPMVGMNVKYKVKYFVDNKLEWDFGDGVKEKLTGKTQYHTYNNPGVYIVKVYDFDGATNTAINCNVNIGADNRSIEVAPASPFVNQQVNLKAKFFFSNNLRWEYGDGHSANGGANIQYSYATQGNFTIKVKDLANPSLAEVTKNINILPDNRSLNISPTPVKAKQQINVQAINFSSTNLKWKFDEGPTETQPSPISHIFLNPGNYKIRVWNADDNQQTALEKSINVSPDNRNINITPSNPAIYQEINFNPLSFPVPNLEWNMGDGTSLTGPGPKQHTYTRMGKFTVKVKGAGTENIPVEKEINIFQDIRNIQMTPLSGNVGQSFTIKLMNSQANNVDWLIDGEYLKKNAPNTIQHQFLDPGQFEISCQIPDQTPVKKTISINDNRSIEVSPKHLFTESKAAFETRYFNAGNLKWVMGDGKTIQAGRKYTHVYKSPGLYKVKVYDFGGQSKTPVEKSIRVHLDKREIILNSQYFYVDAELTAEAKYFLDNTIKWDFGDGQTKLGGKLMTHKYQRAGTFTIKAIDLSGRDTKIITEVINVENDKRTVMLPEEIIAGEKISLQLKNVSGGNFVWEFTDGQRETGQFLKDKKFATPGTKTIKIFDQTKKYPPFEKKINVKPDLRTLKSSADYALPNDTINFQAINFNGPKVKWIFDDGTVKVSGAKTETHKFKSIGKYNVQAIDFGGQSNKTFSTQITISELTPDFKIQLVEMAFTNGKYYRVVSRKSKPPSYYLKIKAEGRGVIKGKWLLNNMTIGLFETILRENQTIHLKGNEVAKLPVIDQGLHNLTFEFSNYQFARDLPILRYFITVGGAIKIKYPESDSKITDKKSIFLKWFLNKKAARYQIAISKTPFQFLKDKQIKWKKVGKKSEFNLNLTKFKASTWIYWMVREISNTGRVLTTSEIASFKII